MNLLAALLTLQVAVPCRTADQEADAGWRAYRAGAIGPAGVHFARADSLCAGHTGAAVGLLNVTDPSSRRVLTRVTAQPPFHTGVTDGFRFVASARDRRSGTARGRVPATPPFAWATWTVPDWHERLKPAYYAMQRLWASW